MLQKSSVETPFYCANVFLKLQQIRDILKAITQKVITGNPFSRLLVLFIFDILFRIHKRDTAAEKGFEIV